MTTEKNDQSPLDIPGQKLLPFGEYPTVKSMKTAQVGLAVNLAIHLMDAGQQLQRVKRLVALTEDALRRAQNDLRKHEEIGNLVDHVLSPEIPA